MSKMKHTVFFSFAPPAQQVFEICRACKLITDESPGWDGLIKLYLKKNEQIISQKELEY